MTIFEELARLPERTRTRKLEGLTDYQASLLLQGLTEDLLDRCRTDGLFWLKWVSTRDEADPVQSVKPFPVHLDYIQQLWRILESRQCVIVAKSRQMLVSWIAAAFCCWWARFKTNQAVYWQTQQWPDACGMIARPQGAVLGRCHFIESHLPRWMQVPLKTAEGVINYPDGSFVQALAGGADQVRGKVPSVLVEDEFAMQTESSGVYAAAAPLIQKGAKMIVISTPNGTANTFSTLYHGRAIGGSA